MKNLCYFVYGSLLVVICQSAYSDNTFYIDLAHEYYDTLVSAETDAMLTNVLEKCRMLPADGQEHIIALCLRSLGDRDIITNSPVFKESEPDASIGGRCAWLAGRLLNVELPLINAHTPRENVPTARNIILLAVQEGRKNLIPSASELVSKPLMERIGLARDVSTPFAVLAILAENSEAAVRVAVAANPGTHPSVLLKLATNDTDPEVREMAVENMKNERTVAPDKVEAAMPNAVLQEYDIPGMKIERIGMRSWLKGIDSNGHPAEVGGIEQYATFQNVQVLILYAEFAGVDEAHQAAEFYSENMASIFRVGLWEGASHGTIGDESWYAQDTATTALLIRSVRTCILISCNDGDAKKRSRVAEIIGKRIESKVKVGGRVIAPNDH